MNNSGSLNSSNLWKSTSHWQNYNDFGVDLTMLSFALTKLDFTE